MMHHPTSIVVALSGGMDSALAAALLKRAGWEVHGLHLLLPDSPQRIDEKIEKVGGIARHLDIPLSVLELRETFAREIVHPFIEAYLRGVTPNPCVSCNPGIKFRALLQFADQNGIDRIATGHYARIGSREEGASIDLLRGLDGRKDQSYFLQRLSRPYLARVLFPLGALTKKAARAKAREMEIPVHSAPESQEICFLSGRDYRAFIKEEGGVRANRPGPIINLEGEILGEHGGAYRYTIGQRQGLGIASSRPYYVKEIRSEKNEVIVGRKEDLFSRRVEATSFYWLGEIPRGEFGRVEAQVRNRHRPAGGRLETADGEKVTFVFDEPQWAVTPGQALACYAGERLLGGGWIIRPECEEGSGQGMDRHAGQIV